MSLDLTLRLVEQVTPIARLTGEIMRYKTERGEGMQDLITATRSGRWFLQGLSPRAGIALVRAAKAQALISGRDYVAPDDVQAIIAQTIAHRLVPVGDAGRGAVEQVQAMVQSVALP